MKTTDLVYLPIPLFEVKVNRKDISEAIEYWIAATNDRKARQKAIKLDKSAKADKQYEREFPITHCDIERIGIIDG